MSRSRLATALLRALIPSWNFFDRIGDTPELRLRRIDARGLEKDWQVHPSFRPIPRPTRGLFSLFHNPEGNARLAEKALVFRALEEIAHEGEEDFRRSPTYRLLVELAARGVPVAYPRMQFQIWIADEEFFLSDIFEAVPPGALAGEPP